MKQSNKDKLQYPWNMLADETYWTLGGLLPNRKIKWFKRKKTPQEWIDLMNGKPVKMKLNIKDWKMHVITTKED